jgi:hypothetical protein
MHIYIECQLSGVNVSSLTGIWSWSCVALSRSTLPHLYIRKMRGQSRNYSVQWKNAPDALIAKPVFIQCNLQGQLAHTNRVEKDGTPEVVTLSIFPAIVDNLPQS